MYVSVVYEWLISVCVCVCMIYELVDDYWECVCDVSVVYECIE